MKNQDFQETFRKAMNECSHIEAYIAEQWLNDLSIGLALVTLVVALIGAFSEIKRNPDLDGFSFSNTKPIGYIVVMLIVLSGIGNVFITEQLDIHQKRAECQSTAREQKDSHVIISTQSLVTEVSSKTSVIKNSTDSLDSATGEIKERTREIGNATADLGTKTTVLNKTTGIIQGTVSQIDNNVKDLGAAIIRLQTQSRQLENIKNQINELAKSQYERDLLQNYVISVSSIDASGGCSRYNAKPIYWVIYVDGKQLSSVGPKDAIQTNGESLVVPDRYSGKELLSKTGITPFFTFSGYVRYENGKSFTGVVKYPYNASFVQDVYYMSDDGSFLIDAAPDCSINIKVSIEKQARPL